MFVHSYQKLISKIALFVVLFASLAPTVSHALALYTGNSAFSQTLCTSTGKVVLIQVVTTKGSIITTELVANDSKASDSTPNSKHLELNLAHCPFCNAGGLHLAINPPSDIWLFNLPKQVKAPYVPADVHFQSAYFQTAHLSRAPPVLL